jgi:hypothetical protein
MPFQPDTVEGTMKELFVWSGTARAVATRSKTVKLLRVAFGDATDEILAIQIANTCSLDLRP